MLVSRKGMLSAGSGHSEVGLRDGSEEVRDTPKVNRGENFGFLPMGASGRASARAKAPRGWMPRGEGTA